MVVKETLTWLTDNVRKKCLDVEYQSYLRQEVIRFSDSLMLTTEILKYLPYGLRLQVLCAVIFIAKVT